MSSTGAIPTNTAPLVLRVDPDNPLSVNNTFVLDKLGNPVPSGSVQLIAPLGQIVYGNSLSTLTVSSLNAPNHAASTLSVTSTLNLNNSASIVFNNTSASNLLSTIGTTLYFNGHQVALGTSGDSFWQPSGNATVNTNDGPVSTTKNLIVAGGATINQVTTLSTLSTNNINVANDIYLFGGNAILAANPTYDAAYLEMSNNTPFKVTNIISGNDTTDRQYAYFSTINSNVSNNFQVYSASSKYNEQYYRTDLSNNIVIDIDANNGDYGSIEVFQTNGSGSKKPLVLNGYSGGNVGINTTSPSAQLDVNGTGIFTGLLTLNNALTITAGGTNITGGATINNSATINGGATINGLLTSNNAIIINNGATINGLLTANNGASTIGNHTVTGTLYANTPTFYNNAHIFNSGVTSSNASLSLNTGNGGYTMYTTTSQGSPPTSGLTPSTLQIYSYYGPNPNARNVLTIYPGGRTDVLSTLNVITGGANITGPTNINGTLATSNIQMTNGTITGVNTINGVVFPPTSQGNLPVGSIIMWNGAALDLPSGFALCDGGTYNIPGGTTRVTPDLRGRFIMGATYATSGTIRYNGSTGPATLPVDENGVTVPALYTNQTGGEINHTLTIDEMPSHNHPYMYRDPTGAQQSDFYSGSYWSPTDVNANTSNTGGGQSHNNIPQYYILGFIMRIF